MKIIAYVIILCGLWLLWSGIYKPLLIMFGVGSVILVLIITIRMNKVDEENLAVELNLLKLISYCVWLLGEIAKSNIAVTKTVLSSSMPINQNLFNVPYSQKTDLAQVIFANSITLTPGTVSVETEEGNFLVHALSYSDNDLEALENMDRRVSAIELAKQL